MRKQLAAGDSLGHKWASDFESRFKEMKLEIPSIQMPDMGAIKAPEMSMGGMGDLAATMRQSLQPLNEAIGGIRTSFNQIGQDIVALLRRIDANMKFPTMDKTLSGLRALTQKTFGEMEGKAKRFGQVLDTAILGAQTLNRARTFFLNYKKIATDGFAGSAKSVNTVQAATQAATGAMRSFGAQVALSLGAFGATYKAVGFLKSGITGASDLNETISKTEAILGDSAPAVKTFADGLARDFGLIKRETLDAASSFGGLGKGLGKLTGNDLSSFTKEFTLLAADLQSYANIGTLDEASKALTIALSGEQSDTLKRLGVIVNDTTIKEYALANGFKVVSGAVSESDKFLIRRRLIMQGLSDVQGDLAKTANGTANQMRKFSGTLTNLGTDVGQLLLPAVNTAVSILNRTATGLSGAFERSKGTIAGVVDSISQGFNRVGQLASYLLPSFLKIGSTLVGAFTGGGAAITGIIPDFSTLAVGAKSALEAINTGLQKTIDWIKSIPQWIDDTFGKGTTAKIGEVAVAIGGTAAALSVLGGTFGVVVAGAAALLAPLMSVPILAASAGVGLAYLTGSYKGLEDATSAVDFALKNSTDMFAWWYNSATNWIDNLGKNFDALVDAVKGFSMGKGWNFKAVELVDSKEMEAAAARMAKNTFAPKNAIAPPPMPAFDSKSVQAQVAAIVKTQAPAVPAFDAAKKKADDKAAKDIESFAKTFIEKTRTPLERYNEAMREATEALKAGKITQDQFDKNAQKYAFKEADFGEAKFSNAITASSQEGYSAILQASQGRDYDGKDLSKPTNETAKNTREMASGIRAMAQKENAKFTVFNYK